jgi:hypothetical protein
VKKVRERKKHIFLLLSLWREEKCGGMRWQSEIFREKIQHKIEIHQADPR